MKKFTTIARINWCKPDYILSGKNDWLQCGYLQSNGQGEFKIRMNAYRQGAVLIARPYPNVSAEFIQGDLVVTRAAEPWVVGYIYTEENENAEPYYAIRFDLVPAGEGFISVVI